MRITLDIPDELCIVAFSLIAPRLPDGSIHTFTHCCALHDGEVLYVDSERQNGKLVYRALEKEEGDG